MTTPNLELTAHELMHVVQRTGGVPLQTQKREEEGAPPGPEPSIQRICAACAADDREEKESEPIAGQKLLGHELTHVLQQSGGKIPHPQLCQSGGISQVPAGSVQRKASKDDEDKEEKGGEATRRSSNSMLPSCSIKLKTPNRIPPKAQWIPTIFTTIVGR